MINPFRKLAPRVGVSALTVVLGMVLACPMKAEAKGSSHGSGGSATQAFIPIEDAQRVMHFSSERVWGTTDGVVLVCPFGAETSPRAKECTTRASENAWVPLFSLTVPGHEISGVQFVFSGSGGYKQLLVFWRKKQ